MIQFDGSHKGVGEKPPTISKIDDIGSLAIFFKKVRRWASHLKRLFPSGDFQGPPGMFSLSAVKVASKKPRGK